MQNDQPRIPPIMPPDWDEEKLDALNAFPGGLKFVLNGWEEEGKPVRGTHMLGSLVQHPALAKTFLTFNNHVATNSTLDTRERELIIMRTGWLRKCEYEYIMHVILGMRCGISEEEISRIQEGPDANGWDSREADLIRIVDELCFDAKIADATWERLSKHYNHQQLMDMIFLVGCYEIVAMTMRSLNVPMEPGVEQLDDDTRARMFGQ